MKRIQLFEFEHLGSDAQLSGASCIGLLAAAVKAEIETIWNFRSGSRWLARHKKRATLSALDRRRCRLVHTGGGQARKVRAELLRVGVGLKLSDPPPAEADHVDPVHLERLVEDGGV